MECCSLKKTTLAEIKRKAKKGETVSILIYPSKIKPNTGWIFDGQVEEVTYEKGEFISWCTHSKTVNTLESTLYLIKHYQCDEKQGKTLTYYEV